MFKVDFYSKLLQKVVTKVFNNSKEAFEFAEAHNSVVY